MQKSVGLEPTLTRQLHPAAPGSHPSWVVMPKMLQHSTFSPSSQLLQRRFPAVLEVPQQSATNKQLDNSHQVMMLDRDGSPCLVQLVRRDTRSHSTPLTDDQFTRPPGHQQPPMRGSVIPDSAAGFVREEPQFVQLANGQTVCVARSAAVVQPESKVNPSLVFLESKDDHRPSSLAQSSIHCLPGEMEVQPGGSAPLGNQPGRRYFELKKAVLLPPAKQDGNGSSIFGWISGEEGRQCVGSMSRQKSV